MNEIVEQTESKGRIVTLQNGEVTNFGVRNNLLTSFDTETGVITFKVITGEHIQFDVTTVEAVKFDALSELAKQVILFGYLQKIKSNLAPVKVSEEVEHKDEEGNVVSTEVVNTLANAIKKEVDKLSKGVFTFRSASSDEGFELSVDQKAFALAVATHPTFAAAVKVSAEQSNGWSDTDAEATIEAVSALWDSYDVKVRNKIRRNGYFLLEKGKLTAEESSEALVD